MSAASPTLDTLMADFVRRRRRIRATGVMCLSVAIVLTWLLGASIIDRLFALSPIVRLIAGGMLLLLTLFAAWRIVRLLMSRQFNRLIAAAQIEAMSPDLRDRLTTVVTQQSLPPSQRGSAALTQLIAGGVTAALSHRPPEKLITSRHIAPAVVLLAVVGTLTVALLPVPWLGLPRLLARQLMPLADIPPVTTTRIEIVTGSVDLPQGQSLAIVADIARGDGQAKLLVGSDDRSLQPVAMARTFGERFAVTLPAVEHDLIYRVRSGDAISEANTVRILRRPALAKLRLTMNFPDYLKRQSLTTESIDGHIEAVRGTRVSAKIQSNEALKDAVLDIGGQLVASTATIDPHVRETSFIVDKPSRWSIDLVSTRDVHGNGLDGMEIVAVDDRPPIVQLARSDMRLHPSDVVAVAFQAIDDFGIEQMRLDVQAGERTLLSRAIDLGAERRMLRDVATFDLAPHALSFGEVVTLTLTATDGAGQSRASSPCRVLLSPRSVDARVLRRIDAIGEALRLAESIPQQPGDAAACLRALMRVIATSDLPEASDYVERQIDRAQRLTSGQVWGQSALGPRELEVAKQLVEALRTLHRSEQAKLLIAELENIRTAGEARKETSKAEQEAVRLSIQRARSEVDSRVKVLDLDPRASDLPRRLKQIIDAAESQVQGNRGPMAQRLAENWVREADPAVQRDRIAIAAQSQILRSDSDLVWARDLQSIARAMSCLQDRTGARPSEMVEVVKSLQNLHIATRKNAGDRANLIPPAEMARKRLRDWAGEAAKEAPSARSPMEDAVDKTAVLQEERQEAQADASKDSSEGSEKWEPPSKTAADADKPASQAQQLSEIAKQQQKVNRRTEAAAAEAAPKLGQQQQQIAEALKEVEKQKEEDFFEKDQTPQREQALEALRQAQRALADLPQSLGDLRRQAEMVAAMQQSAERARAAAESASEADAPAANRAAAEAARQLEAARQQLRDAAGNASSQASASLQASATKLGAIGKPMSGGERQLAGAMEQLAKNLTEADLQSAESQQARVLDSVAALQTSLRVAQRQTVDRDPVIAARFFAQKATDALKQQPSDMPAAREYQKQTTEALNRAWDSAMARAVKDKLQQLPAFQSLLFDDMAFEGSGGDAALMSERTVASEWGRLREKRDASTTTGNTAFVPPGYEETLRLYFQTLDKARSGGKEP